MDDLNEIGKVMDPEITYGSLSDNDIYTFMSAARKGIKYSKFLEIANLSPFDILDWSSFLHLSERTLQRYKKEQGTFDVLHSELIIQLTLLFKYGNEVFGNKDYFNTWLNSVNLALGSIKPKQLLDSYFGIELIKDELTRIEHGVLA
jgi:putative toxin-antitoxin system antitoxin component (TIGR02293 family)